MRKLLSFFSPKKFFGVSLNLRVLTALTVLMLCTPPQFAAHTEKKQPALSDRTLPMPSVRYQKRESNKETAAPQAAESIFPNLNAPPSSEFETPSNEVLASELSANEPAATALSIKVGLNECNPWQFCEQKPSVKIQATGLINKSKIAKIQVQVGKNGKVFDGENITIRLPPTEERGNWLTYWAITEDGRRSSISRLKYINYKPDAKQDQYYFAMLGKEWVEGMPSGSLVWEMFPPIGDQFPATLEQPLTAGYLYTTNRYSYLAGQLIISGNAKASGCADGGIYTNGYATPCGDQKAAEKVLEWQNRYDQQIYDSSIHNNIPAKILKAMFAQETQFWPTYKNPYEIGLGALTPNGVDMLLNWNQRYFLALCSDAYGKKECAHGYSRINKGQQMILNRSVWDRALAKTDEIDILGAVLYASAAQVSQMVSNTRFAKPGDIAPYEDMWKLAVANYHSGSGCIGVAMKESAKMRDAFTWKSVGTYLLGDCQQAIGYVEKVWRYAGGQP